VNNIKKNYTYLFITRFSNMLEKYVVIVSIHLHISGGGGGRTLLQHIWGGFGSQQPHLPTTLNELFISVPRGLPMTYYSSCGFNLRALLSKFRAVSSCKSLVVWSLPAAVQQCSQDKYIYRIALLKFFLFYIYYTLFFSSYLISLYFENFSL